VLELIFVALDGADLPRDPEGTLYKPGEAGRIHGEGSGAGKEAELASSVRNS